MITYLENWTGYFVSVYRTAAMTEQLSGFTGWAKKVTSESESMHCVTHKEMLDSQKMSREPNNILWDVIKINHIKVHALNSLLFS